jgi:hypothetical protein
MMREPTQEEREKIVRAIAAGDRIGATSVAREKSLVKIGSRVL